MVELVVLTIIIANIICVAKINTKEVVVLNLKLLKKCPT